MVCVCVGRGVKRTDVVLMIGTLGWTGRFVPDFGFQSREDRSSILSHSITGRG